MIFPLIFACAVAQEEQEDEAPAFRTVPWSVWGGIGTDFDGYSLSLAARRGPWGLGFGYNHDTKEARRLPAFNRADPPATIGGETVFSVSTVGMDIYTKTPIADFVDGYASIGAYVDVNTLLVQDSTSGQYYESVNSPDWTNVAIAYGGGIEFNPLSWLIAGIGYHNVRGLNVHVGVTW